MNPTVSHFPCGVRFAHLSTHLCVLFREGPAGPEPLQMRKDFEEAVARHDGPLFVLTPRRADTKALKQTLSEVGLEVAGPPVAEVVGPLADLTLGPLFRRVPSW